MDLPGTFSLLHFLCFYDTINLNPQKEGAHMKKLLFSLLTLCMAFSLTSCQVNWFGETYDAPWYMVAVPVILIFVVGYLVIWAVIYSVHKARTARLNEILKRKQQK